MKNDELFCSKCLIHDKFFVGGGSWSPSCCPKCRGTDCILFKNLNIDQKLAATKRYNNMIKVKK